MNRIPIPRKVPKTIPRAMTIRQEPELFDGYPRQSDMRPLEWRDVTIRNILIESTSANADAVCDEDCWMFRASQQLVPQKLPLPKY